MTNNIEELLTKGNMIFQYKLMRDKASIFTDEDYPRYPVLILSCMDPRIDVYELFQLEPGDMFILRNAGNILTDDVKRAILIAIIKYHIRFILILGHLDCGMTKINLEELNQSVPHAILESITSDIRYSYLDLREYFKPFSDEIENIRKQVDIIRNLNGMPKYIEVRGMLYDIVSGWVFDEEDLKGINTMEEFKQNMKYLMREKKTKLIRFLGSLHEKNEVQTRENIKKPIIIDSDETKAIQGQSNDQPLGNKPQNKQIKDEEQKMEGIKNEFSIKMPQIIIPEIFLPRINVNVPKLCKSGFIKEMDD